MNRFFIISAFAILLVGCGSKPSQEEGKAAEPVVTVEMANATTQTIRDLMPVDGSYTLSPGDYAKLSPVTAGKLQTLFVKEGDSVRQGQLLAKIDTSVMDAQRASAVAGAASADAQAKQSQASLNAAKADYDAGVRTAQLNLQATISEQNSLVAQAKVDLDRLRAGSRPQEISQAEQSVRQAQVNRDKAFAEAERDSKLLAEGYVSGQQADASKAAYEVADSALIQAKAQLDLVKLGARPEEMKAAELRYSSAHELRSKRIALAKAALDQAQMAKLGVDAKQQETSAARLAATGKKADAAAAAGLVANGEIRAPFDGIVTRKFLGSGSAVDATTPIFEIARKGAHIEFSGQVSPRDSASIHPGMEVSSDAQKESNGSVLSVGMPDAQSGQVLLRIVFHRPPANVTAGLFGRVNIVLRQISGAVVVPNGAIVTRDDKKVVFIVDSDVAKMQEVEVGPSELGLTVIEKGIKTGQRVVLVGQHELSDGAKVEEPKPAEEDKKGAEK